jgi:hypothetical protein
VVWPVNFIVTERLTPAFRGLDGPEGHWFVIGVHLQDTPYGKNKRLYWCQYKPRQAEEPKEKQLFTEIKKEEPPGSSSSVDRAFGRARAAYAITG